MAVKELKTSEEARTKANSSAEAAARQADKLTQKLANMPKVCYCCICFAPNVGFDGPNVGFDGPNVGFDGPNVGFDGPAVGCDVHGHQPKADAPLP